MTDYFTLLHQPRSPAIDPENLKQSYYEQTLQLHPDVQRGDSSTGPSASLNEAYEVLRNPKRRLQHFLSLEGAPPSARPAEVPERMQALFPTVSKVTQAARATQKKLDSTSNRLSRSLLRGELLARQSEVDELLRRLREQERAIVAEFSVTDSTRSAHPDERIKTLTAAYHELTYLTRWLQQMEELQMALSFQS